MRVVARTTRCGNPKPPALPGDAARVAPPNRGLSPGTPSPGRAGGFGRGITILELLVVILIMLMVTAAAIPIVAPAMQNRRMRESARLVSSYFSAARGRAIETGRPVGVVVERFNGQPFGMVLSQVEVPPPYAGDIIDARCTVVAGGPTGAMSENNIPLGMDAMWFIAAMDPSFNPRLVRVGDQIQFNGTGPLYTILGPDEMPAPDGVIDPGVPLDVAYLYPTGSSIAHLRFPWANPVATPQPPAYQIIRQPTRSFTAPLQLPEGIVVDLTCSGMGATGTFFDPINSFGGPGVMTGSVPAVGPNVVFDPVIMFSPSGRLESVSQGANGRLARPTDAIYLLLGRRELMFDATQKNLPSDVVNQNLSSIPAASATIVDSTTWPAPPLHFWVSIGYQTGLITVAEVAPNLQDYTTAGRPLRDVITDALTSPPAAPENLTGARQFARESQSVGGR